MNEHSGNENMESVSWDYFDTRWYEEWGELWKLLNEWQLGKGIQNTLYEH